MRQQFRMVRWAPAFAAAILALATAVPASAGQQADTAAAPQGPVRAISVDEAVALALENNLNVQVQRVTPQVRDLQVAQAKAAWLPTFNGNFSTRSSNSPVGNIFAGARTKLTTDMLAGSVGVNQVLPWTGGNYTVAWDTSRQESNNAFATRNPTLGAGLELSFTQPLLRNLRIDSSRQQLQVSLNNRDLADLELRQTLLTTVRNVRVAYWELSYQRSSLEVQRQSLALAEESLRNNRARVEIGTMAPIDIIEAQAEVAAREESVILAEAAVAQAEDRLRALIFDPKDPDFWTLRLELTDQPVFEARDIDVEAAVRRALEQRTDIRQARKELETTDVNIKFYRNQTLPDVSLQADYSVAAQGGIERVLEGFPDPIETSRTERSYGQVMRSLFGRDFPTWSFGVRVGYPLGRSSAEAALARATLERNQAQTRIRNLEMQIVTQIRDLARQVNTNRKRVEATRASREFAERRLEAEQKKFAAGMSTSYFVFQAQRDLAQARNAELRAILDYNRSLVDLETGQEAPVSGM